jgi:hypothetical protein
MKNNLLLLGISSFLMLTISCEKDNNSANYSVINSEKDKIINAYELSQAFSDTLKTVYDAAPIPYYNSGCIKYDTLYHNSDSLFRVHYALFCDEMYKNNIMMPYYIPSNGMMQGGMMGSGSMGMQELRGDTSEVNGYYRNMHNLRASHQMYHNGIYN